MERIRQAGRGQTGALPLTALAITDLANLATVSPALGVDIAAAEHYARSAKSAATLRAYASDWRIYQTWCSTHDLSSLPASAEQVAVFIAHQAQSGTAVSTLVRRIAAIGHHHKVAGQTPPTGRDGAGRLSAVLAGIKAEHGRPAKRKRAARSHLLVEMLASCEGATLRPLRDRAILALGMAAALRRSEIVALEVADLQFRDEGVDVFIARSKTDQQRDGATIPVIAGSRLKPVSHLRAWLDASGHTAGPLFRRLTRHDERTELAMSDRAVARIVKGAAAALGLDPRDYSGHSLRAGFLTEAAHARATIPKMQDVSRHKTVAILLDYVRSAEMYDDHAGANFL